MGSEASGALTLEIAPRGGWTDTLLVEESAEFDLFLRNVGSAPESAQKLHGSLETPRLVLFDSTGTELGAYTKAHRIARRGADLAQKKPGRPKNAEIPPGGELTLSLNLWTFRPAAQPGRYAMAAEHRVSPAGPVLTSNRHVFEVVAADVKDVALGYDSAERTSSVTAWAAASRTDPAHERLLVRVSSPRGHATLLQGASFHGEFGAGLRVAVGQLLHGVGETGLPWIAAVSGSQVTFIRHNLSYPHWKSDPVALPFERCTPIARFPDLGQQALFLALDDAAPRNRLCGVLIDATKGVESQWTVPLPEAPSLIACSGRLKRPVTLLLATNDAVESRVSRLQISASGKMVSKAEVLHRSNNRVLAIATAVDPGSGYEFLFVEADRDRHDHLAVLHVPVGGPIKKLRPRQVKGWPTDRDGVAIPVAEVQIEEAVGGDVGIAFTTADGAFHAGRLAPKALVGTLREQPESRSSFPHVAALYRKMTPSCFTAEGAMFFPASGGSH